MKISKPLVSILVINFNNSKYIEECINSLKSQTYNNIEIIFYDDNSKDNSLKIIRRFKNIKIISNRSQTKFGSLNQINGFKKSFKMSKGDIIFFLDSDDFFKKNKVQKIVNHFLNNKTKKIVFDFPIIKKRTKEKFVENKINLFKTYWGYIHPTSCISFRSGYLKKLLKKLSNDKFTDIWMDLRILLYSKYENEYNIVNENLTFYRQFDGNVSSKFSKFSKSWWKRREQAHEYFLSFTKKNNIEVSKNIDFYITKLKNNFL